MIKLRKQSKPSELSKGEVDWTSGYKLFHNFKKQNTAKKPNPYKSFQSKYKQEFIKNALRSETSGKCAYCESRMEATSPAHIEHILPKDHRPDLVVDWANLTFSCFWCNIKKGTYYSTSYPLVNPYQDEPAAHIDFRGPFARALTTMGLRTLNEIDLGRVELNEMRAEEVNDFESWVEIYKDANSPLSNKRIAYRQILKNLEPGSAYIAAKRAYLKLAGIDETHLRQNAP